MRTCEGGANTKNVGLFFFGARAEAIFSSRKSAKCAKSLCVSDLRYPRRRDQLW